MTFQTVNAAGPNSLSTTFGASIVPLTQSEMTLFARSFERQFIAPFASNDKVSVLSNLYTKHIAEAIFGAGVAKFQMNQAFGGEVPSSGYIGMSPIRAAWLGVGNDWNDQPVLAAASLTNWIHAGTSLMAGTAGHAIKIGQYEVTVWIAYASNHPSPKVESLALTIDGKPKAGIVIGQTVGRNLGSIGNSLNINEFDAMVLLNQNRLLLAQLWSDPGGADIPVALGFSFIPEPISRVYINPSGLPGSTNNVVLVT